VYNVDSHKDARRVILGSAEREGSVSFPFFAVGSLADSSDLSIQKRGDENGFRVDLKAWRSWEGYAVGLFQLLVRAVVT